MSVADTPALLEEARRGDNDACARLIEENAGLIWSIVRRYYGRGTDPEDLSVSYTHLTLPTILLV